MSADNAYMVRQHPTTGKYVAVMFSYSDPDEPAVDLDTDYEQFEDPMGAFMWAQSQPSEYGVSIHPECPVRKLSKSDP